METLLNNKNFIRIAIVFVALLSLLSLAKFVNEVRESKYIGSDKPALNVISVSGTGDVSAVPDIAVLSFSLSKDAKTAGEAQKILNESITATLSYLDTQKIDKKDIKSDYGGVNPKYDYVYEKDVVCGAYTCPPRPGKQVISGYTATQNIEVKIRAVDTANEVRTGLSKLGIQNIYGPTFSIDDESKLKNEARSLAIQDAKQKAEVLAKDLGVRLVRITSFSENSGGYPMMYAGAKAMDSASVSTPAPELPKGENKITSNVNITYEIR